jgi:predicted GIY-YIG superfamily endonuclease
MSFWVYILQCSDGTYYTGHTDNLEARIAKHQQGAVEGYTSKHLPVKLVFSSEFPTRDDAFARERQIKGWSRRKKGGINQRKLAQIARIFES